MKGQTVWAKLCCSMPLSRTGGLLYVFRFNVAAVGTGGGFVEKRRELL